MDKTRIIVVEDNIVYCEYVCNILKREGYNTVQAYHLSTAKKHLQQATDDDIIVSDLRLNDGNGIDLLRWMRKEGKMQPNAGAIFTTVRMISSVSCVSRQIGTALTPPNSLNRTALPSMIGIAARGPILPRPNTALPSDTTAIVLDLIV